MNDRELPTNVTFVELEDLWQIANRDLVDVANEFYEQSGKAEELVDIDTSKYGLCIETWLLAASQLRMALYLTAENVNATSDALGEVVEMYTHTDGDNASKLNKAGELLDTALDGDKPQEEVNADDYKPEEIDPTASKVEQFTLALINGFNGG